MNIAIFDLQHYEMVNVILNVFNEPTNKLYLLSNNNIINKCNQNLIYNSICADDYNKFNDFCNACYEYLTKNNIDFIIFNTIDTEYKSVWQLIHKLKIPVVVTIHNINTWLKPPFTLNRIALKNYYYRKRIINKTNAIILQEELFIKYVKQQHLYKKKIFTLPHTFKEKNISEKQSLNEKLIIAIPGGIDGHRRDYDLCLSVIEKIYKQNSNLQFKFIGAVLGKLGEEILKRIYELKNTGIDIEHLYSNESNKLFDTEMSNCDLVFLPLNVYTQYEGITEIYGQTKVTGVLYDMMRFEKPGIVPEKLVIPDTIKTSTIKYTNEDDLIMKVLDIANNKEKLNLLKQNAKNNSQYYTLSEIKKRFLNEFTQTILN
jgi:glycosyltransferase involved in cell wall biosynthesis